MKDKEMCHWSFHHYHINSCQQLCLVCFPCTNIQIWQRLSSSGYVFSASLPHILRLLQSQLLTFWSKSQSDRKLKKNIAVLWKGLSQISGFTNASNAESPIVYLRLKKSTGSMQDDLDLLEDIAERVLREDSVFVVASKRSTLDKCRLPVGIIFYVSCSTFRV